MAACGHIGFKDRQRPNDNLLKTPRSQNTQVHDDATPQVQLAGLQIWSQSQGHIHSFGPEDKLPLHRKSDKDNGQMDRGRCGLQQALSCNRRDPAVLFLLDTHQNAYFNLPDTAAEEAIACPDGFPASARFTSFAQLSPALLTLTMQVVGFFADRPAAQLQTGIPASVPIDTSVGCKNVEHLKPGDMILCKDGQYQPLQAIFSDPDPKFLRKCFDGLALIHFPAFSIGNHKAIHLSAGQQVLSSDPSVEYEFGSAEVFITALDYPGLTTARKETTSRDITTYQLEFTKPQIISANGAWIAASNLQGMSDTWLESARATGRLTESDSCAGDKIHHDQPKVRSLHRFEARALLASLDQRKFSYSRLPNDISSVRVANRFSR